MSSPGAEGAEHSEHVLTGTPPLPCCVLQLALCSRICVLGMPCVCGHATWLYSPVPSGMSRRNFMRGGASQESWHLYPACSVAAPQTELGDLAKYDGPQHKAHAQLTEPANYQAIESGLTFLGLCGLMDPPRPEVCVPAVR